MLPVDFIKYIYYFRKVRIIWRYGIVLKNQIHKVYAL